MTKDENFLRLIKDQNFNHDFDKAIEQYENLLLISENYFSQEDFDSSLNGDYDLLEDLIEFLKKLREIHFTGNTL